MDFGRLYEKLRRNFGEKVSGREEFRGQTCVLAAREAVHDILHFLRDEPEACFAMLTDVTAVDYLRLPPEQAVSRPERFAVVYQLTSLEHGARLRVKTFIPENDCRVASVSDLWAAALWGEREVYDMYGVLFDGHPDLRRILMPDDYDGHPLRKDYPLKGRGERDCFPKYSELPNESAGN